MVVLFLLHSGGAPLGSESGESSKSPTIRYLALGDSYTIGQSVDAKKRWPLQLADLLRRRGYMVEDPVIIARTGWSTGELLAAIEKENPSGTFELVSLLIGVNDQFRGGNIEDRVLVLSIPDWGVTPYAKRRGRTGMGLEIDLFNDVNRAETVRAGVRYLDITEGSRRANADSTLIASDGLHPSAKMYADWARLALVEAIAALGEGH